MRRVLSCAIAAAALLAATTVHAQESKKLPRVASINVCTDQLLLALADPDQIAGLSPFSRDPASSWFASRARHFRRLSGEAEDVLMLRPDVVVAGLFSNRATRELLIQHGSRVEGFDFAQSVADVRRDILRMGEIVGHPKRAQREVARLDAALARMSAAAAGRAYRVLAVERRGWVTGEHSLLSALLRAAGLVNVAGELGIAAGGYQSLETIIRLKPDFIVVSDNSDRAEDQGEAFLLHPALERFYPPAKRIVMPDRMTVCGGTMLVDALDRLTAELARVTAAAAAGGVGNQVR